MQKPQKYIVVICCAVLLVCALSLLIKGTVADVEGKYLGVYTFSDTITLEKKTYTVTYVNNGEDLHSFTVALGQGVDETTLAEYHASALEKLKAQMGKYPETYANVEFSYWMNAGSSGVTSIPEGNTEDIVLYPKFDNLYTAMFVSQDGSLLAWCYFTNANYSDSVENARDEAEKALPGLGNGFTLGYWLVEGTDCNDNDISGIKYDIENFENYKDVTIYPVYEYKGDVKLIPIDEDSDGDTDYYQVGGYYDTDAPTTLVEIPGEVNGIPVTTINADAFSSYDDLHSVLIPGTVTTINAQSFTADDPDKYGTQRDTITMYYAGDPAVWATAMEQYNADDYSGILKENWDNAMGDGSRVFFVTADANGDLKVNADAGYWELNSSYKWVFHNHEYTQAEIESCEHGTESHYDAKYSSFDWSSMSSVYVFDADKYTDYDGVCTCDKCNGNLRPDAEYWTTETES